ncbi:MAG: hypothetical protein AAB467_03255 [Patescibacteria group bacterium]
MDLEVVLESVREVLEAMAVSKEYAATISGFTDSSGLTVDKLLLEATFSGSLTGEINGSLMSKLISDRMDDQNAPNGRQPFHIVVINREMSHSKKHRFKIAGICRRNYCAIVTTRNFDAQNHLIRCAQLRMLTMHEIGHRFGLISSDRATNVFVLDVGGKHCTNDCVMRLGVPLSSSLSSAELRRLITLGFCSLCLDHLRRYVTAWGF